MQSQTNDEMFIVLEKYHQILLHENIKAAPDKSHFSNTCKTCWTYYTKKHYHSIKISHRCNTKFSTTVQYKKIQDFVGVLNFLSEYIYKMQLYLKPFYNILRQQSNFEWTTEHQTRSEKIKTLLTEQISNNVADQDQPIYASNFGIGAALLQSHNGTNKRNLISASSGYSHKLNLDSLSS